MKTHQRGVAYVTWLCIHAGIVSQRKLGGIAILADDVKGLSVLVLGIGVDDEAARHSAKDGELEIGWDRLVLANGSDWPEAILELTDGVLVP